MSIVELPEQPTAVLREAVAMDALPEFFGRAFAAVGAALDAQHVPADGSTVRSLPPHATADR